jgi:phosphoserine phosphatase
MQANVEALITRLVARPDGRPVVFDADGTLWRGDVGEDLLRYLTHEQLVPGDAWRRYEALLQHSHADAYAFSVEVMAGLELATLQAVADDFFARRFAGRVFRPLRALLERLASAGYQPWVCSASPVQAVLPGAKALGIPPERVVGVLGRVEAGRFTGEVELPVTCGPGKVTWLQRRLGAVRPALAVGNGELDLDMLAWADTALVVAPLDGPDNGLVREAARRGWPVLRA